MISFSKSEQVKRYPVNVRQVSAWLKGCAENYGFEVGELNYRITNDDEILEVNRTYLNHDYYTDIITFDYVDGKVVHGDVVISLDTVRSNSIKFGVNFTEEYLRVCIHGLLHLCGFNDKTDEESGRMRLEENACLKLFHVKH